jgi:uncharacterized membrane protein YfcA
MNELFLSAGLGLAGVLSGAFNLAFPLIAGPLFLLLYKPSEALLLTALCTLLSNLFSAILLRHSIKYELRWQLITPVLIGIPLGTALVTHMETPAALRGGFGLLLAITSAACLLPRKAIIRREHSFAEVAVGILGGVLGGMFAAPIALPAVWLTMKGLDKIQVRALLQPLVIVGQIIIIIILCLTGSNQQNIVNTVGLYTPAVLLGVLCGVFIFKSISTRAYAMAVNVLVLVSGVILMLK